MIGRQPREQSPGDKRERGSHRHATGGCTGEQEHGATMSVTHLPPCSAFMSRAPSWLRLRGHGTPHWRHFRRGHPSVSGRVLGEKPVDGICAVIAAFFTLLAMLRSMPCSVAGWSDEALFFLCCAAPSTSCLVGHAETAEGSQPLQTSVWGLLHQLQCMIAERMPDGPHAALNFWVRRSVALG